MFLIFGTRTGAVTSSGGDFFCPECKTERAYRLKTVRTFYTLFFVPLIPGKVHGRYVECRDCGATFREDVLGLDPAAEEARIRAEYYEALKTVMVLMVLADGEVRDSEIEYIRKYCSDVTGKEESPEEIRKAVEVVRNEGRSVSEHLSAVAPYLNDQGREIIIKAAFTAAFADSEPDAGEVGFLIEIGEALGMSPFHVKATVEQFLAQDLQKRK